MDHFFNVGDTIICVDSSGNARGVLIEGKKYTAYGLKDCEHCPIKMVDVRVVSMGDGFWHQNRFVKAEDNHALEEEIFEAMKGVKIEN